MKASRFTTAGGLALLAALASSGCAQPEPQVVTVTPPVVAVAPAGTSGAPSFQTTIDLAPLQGGREIRLQSFAGDVCVSDGSGGGFVSHCVCAGINCTCQGATGNCTP